MVGKGWQNDKDTNVLNKRWRSNMRLIDANAVQRWLADWQYGEAPTKEDKDKAIVRYEVLDIVRSGLDDPRFTIEAETVRHGKWVVAGNTTHYYICSVCGEPGDGWDNYCRSCGAKMDGK